MLPLTTAIACSVGRDCVEVTDPDFVSKAWEGLIPFYVEWEQFPDVETAKKQTHARGSMRYFSCSDVNMVIEYPAGGSTGVETRIALGKSDFELRKFTFYGEWIHWPPVASDFE